MVHVTWIMILLTGVFVLDNISITTLNMVNELIARHGFEPWDLVVVTHDTMRGTGLRFETPAPEGKEPAFARMLSDLGVSYDGDMPILYGTDQEIISSLRGALAKAPRAKSRH